MVIQDIIDLMLDLGPRRIGPIQIEPRHQQEHQYSASPGVKVSNGFVPRDKDPSSA